MPSKRVRVADYGVLKADDPRLVDAVNKRLHWAAAPVAEAMVLGWNTLRVLITREASTLLRLASGYRERPWLTKSEYEDDLRQRYNKRKDLSCRVDRAGTLRSPCPCYSWPNPPRKACIWLAWESAHFTGLAWDLYGAGLEAKSKTAEEQKLLPVTAWLTEWARQWNEQAPPGWHLLRYEPEPWHWEVLVPRPVWWQEKA